MKILYDYQIFSIQRYGGATKYFCELMKNIPSLHDIKLSLFFSENYYLQLDKEYFNKKNILPKADSKGKNILKRILCSADKQYSRYCLANNKYDVFHPTYYDNYFLDVVKRPYVITVHDLIAFKFQGPFNKSPLVKPQMDRAIKKATRIIAISENTKQDIIDILKVDENKIDVIYHGYNKPLLTNEGNSYGKYILFVGGRETYKNFAGFVNATAVLLNKDKELKLVCVGSSFTTAEKNHLKALGIMERTIVFNVDEDELNSLYANALVFVFPSLYEGFGMPILEAFANNCPVCLSNSSCFPEIAKNAAVYFDPLNQDSILAAMEKIIYDQDFKIDLVEKGKKRLSYFSWQLAAEQTIDCYSKAL